MSGVPSPCNGVCKIDPATDLCMGCFRTLAQIGGWGAASAEEKLAILARAKELGAEGETKACAHCRTYFSCGAAEGQCWCMEQPKVKPDANARGCLCPICLRRFGEA